MTYNLAAFRSATVIVLLQVGHTIQLFSDVTTNSAGEKVKTFSPGSLTILPLGKAVQGSLSSEA